MMSNVKLKTDRRYLIQFMQEKNKRVFPKPWMQTMLILLILLVSSCNSSFTPKPTGYFKIPFPEKKYQLFEGAGYPYSFEYPVYAKIVKDSTFFGDATENPWWINVDFPQFHGRIYVSYKEIGKNKFDTLIKQTFELTSKHTSKAYSIEDSVISTPNHIHGILFTVGGDVATANQFFVTDSTRHFLRGALYFDATPNQDSLGIVNRFLLTDMKHLINTFKWRK
jgi:gliding motility-associated lipoprotein GldD